MVSKGGIVAAQSRKAAEVGAAVLAAGGDCVDAVIATTFALGVLEPWMSGVGGGGAMVPVTTAELSYAGVGPFLHRASCASRYLLWLGRQPLQSSQGQAAQRSKSLCRPPTLEVAVSV